MEDLYKKLFNKYSKLKTEKYAEMEELNQHQETKFIEYVKVTDDVIAYLKSENDKLSREVGELRDEISSISSTKDKLCGEYQKLLIEENQKNVNLQEEINSLRNGNKRVPQKQTGTPTNSTNSTPGLNSETKHGPSSKSATVRMTRKRTRELNLCIENSTQHVTEEVTTPNLLSITDNSPHKQTMVDETHLNSYLPPCCRRETSSSGKDAETVPVSCKFQDLLECVVGMQLSANPENDKFSISVCHLSTGLRFSLKMLNTSRGEAEIEYKVVSFGTFAKTAPDWMKDVLRFSPRMCWIFFRKVKDDLKLNP